MAGTSFEVDHLAPSTTYFWRVRASNAAATSERIVFGLPAAAEVRLRVFDALGRVVAELVRGRLAAGRYEVPWEAPLGAASGVYFYRLDVGERILVGKMLLLN